MPFPSLGVLHPWLGPPPASSQQLLSCLHVLSLTPASLRQRPCDDTGPSCCPEFSHLNPSLDCACRGKPIGAHVQGHRCRLWGLGHGPWGCSSPYHTGEWVVSGEGDEIQDMHRGVPAGLGSFLCHYCYFKEGAVGSVPICTCPPSQGPPPHGPSGCCSVSGMILDSPQCAAQDSLCSHLLGEPASHTFAFPDKTPTM